MIKEKETVNDQEITLKELILGIQDFGKEIIRFKYFIILFAVIMGLLWVISALKENKTYIATQTFMINSDEGGGGIGGLGGILGSIGIGGGGGGKYNLPKVLELSRSRKISQNVLYNKVYVAGSSDFIANHIINTKDSIGDWATVPFYKFWLPESKLSKFRFAHDSISSYDRLENRALKKIHTLLIGNEKIDGIMSSSFDEESGIMEIKVETENEDLSYHLCKKIYSELSEYYITKSIEKQKFTFDIIASKHDSIATELSIAQHRLADFEDKNQRLYSKVDRLKIQRLNQEVQKLAAMYGEVSKNLEIADFSLKSKTPFVQEIDAPIRPLRVNIPSIPKSFLIGFFLGSFLIIVLIIIRKVYFDIMV